jgi:hypothetical protein
MLCANILEVSGVVLLGCVALSWVLAYLIPKMNKLVVQGESPNVLSG